MNAPSSHVSFEVARQRILVTHQALHAHFLAILPRIETHARIRFGYLRCPGRRDDAVAEVVAVCWKWYLRLVEKGKDIDGFVTAFADFAIRHVRSGRRLCGQERSRDVLSPLSQRKHDFRVEALACTTRNGYEAIYADPHGQDHMDAVEVRLRDNAVTPPPEQAAFRIDYPAWLTRLGDRKREIAQDMALDLGTGELASRHGVSAGRISQLRREFHADYRRFHGESVVA